MLYGPGAHDDEETSSERRERIAREAARKALEKDEEGDDFSMTQHYFHD